MTEELEKTVDNIIALQKEEIKELKKATKNTMEELFETRDTNKSLFKACDQFKADIKSQAECIVEMEKELDSKTEVKKVYEMPYVHVKVNKVISGKFPKTDISISAGGALEQIDFDDIGTFTESLIDKIGLEIAEAIKKLEPIQ